MKHRLAVLLLVGLAFSAMLQGAGTVTQTRRNVGNDTGQIVLTVDWTGDASDGSVPYTYLDKDAFRDGYSILQVQTDPGSTAPTDDYDVAFIDEFGADIMAGACANRDTTSTEFCTTDPHPINGSVQIRITNNSVNSATGKVVITLTRNTVARRGGTATGGAGVANDTYACAGSGNNTISHNKNTLNVIVAAYDGSNVQTDWNTLTVTDANTVTVNFTTAVTSRRCVVNSSGGGSGGGGDTTSVANSGASGASVLKTSTNVTARKLVAGTNVTITENTDTIEIAATGGGSGDLTEVQAGTGITVTNGTGPIPVVSVASTVAKLVRVTAVDVNFASMTNGTCNEQTVTVTGVLAGDLVLWEIPASLEAGISVFQPQATANNTVKIRACNYSGSTVDPALVSSTFTAIRGH